MDLLHTKKSQSTSLCQAISFESEYKNSYTPKWFRFLKIPYLVRSFGRNGEVGKPVENWIIQADCRSNLSN